MLLLAIAVVLPSVCLLWFMNQAVKNVQLAARQKLINAYSDEALEVRRFPPHEVPWNDLAFTSTYDALADYVRQVHGLQPPDGSRRPMPF